jgi:outer membrane protein
MQLSRLVAVVAGGFLIASCLRAQEPALIPQKVTLAQCIELALRKNLEVRISRLGPEISTFNLRGSYGVYDPNLQLGVGASGNTRAAGIDDQGRPVGSISENRIFYGNEGAFLGGNLPVAGMSYRIGFALSERETVSSIFGSTEEYAGTAALAEVRLPLLRDSWIDQFRTTIEINRENLNSSELDLQLQVMSVVLRVEQAYYDLIYAREFIRVQRTAFEAADRLLQENRKRVEVGAMAPLEEKSAEAQAAASRAALIAAEGDYGTRMRILKNLITDDYTRLREVELMPIENLGAIPSRPQVQDSWLKGLTLRPDLEQLRLGLRQQNIQLRYLRNQLWPMLDLVGSYGQSSRRETGYGDVFRDIGDGTYPNHRVLLTLSVPLGNRSARNNLASRRGQMEQALLNLAQQEQLVMVQIDNAIAMVRTSFERVGATKQAREFAKDAWDAEQKKLDSGKSTSYEVLLKQRDYIRTLSDEIQALADYNKALADLSFQEGTILDRHNIGLDIR